MSAFALAVLILQPVLDEPATLRLVSQGTGSDVEWILDGVPVAVTRDGKPAYVNASAGRHTLVAQAVANATWTALARPEPDVEGLAHVEGWSATWSPSEALPRAGAWTPPYPLLAAAAAVAGGWGVRRLRVRRTRRRPPRPGLPASREAAPSGPPAQAEPGDRGPDA